MSVDRSGNYRWRTSRQLLCEHTPIQPLDERCFPDASNYAELKNITCRRMLHFGIPALGNCMFYRRITLQMGECMFRRGYVYPSRRMLVSLGSFEQASSFSIKEATHMSTSGRLGVSIPGTQCYRPPLKRTMEHRQKKPHCAST